MTFAPGATITKPEVRDGAVWSSTHAAADVTDLMERDDRWWARWDDWTPASATMGT